MREGGFFFLFQKCRKSMKQNATSHWESLSVWPCNHGQVRGEKEREKKPWNLTSSNLEEFLSCGLVDLKNTRWKRQKSNRHVNHPTFKQGKKKNHVTKLLHKTDGINLIKSHIQLDFLMTSKEDSNQIDFFFFKFPPKKTTPWSHNWTERTSPQCSGCPCGVCGAPMPGLGVQSWWSELRPRHSSCPEH